MAELKTQRTDASVDDFLAGVADPRRREDARTVCALMTEVTGEPPAMWGTAIVGFGAYDYRYASGQTGTWPAAAFSPRKASLTVYLYDFEGRDELLSRLGRHSLGKSCLYLPRLSDVDLSVLRELVRRSFVDFNGRTVTPGDLPA